MFREGSFIAFWIKEDASESLGLPKKQFVSFTADPCDSKSLTSRWSVAFTVISLCDWWSATRLQRRWFVLVFLTVT